MSNNENNKIEEIARDIVDSIINNYHYDAVLDVLYDSYQLNDKEYDQVLNLLKNGKFSITLEEEY